MNPSNSADMNEIEQQLENEYRALQRAEDRFTDLAYGIAGSKSADYVKTPVQKVLALLLSLLYCQMSYNFMRL